MDIKRNTRISPFPSPLTPVFLLLIKVPLLGMEQILPWVTGLFLNPLVSFQGPVVSCNHKKYLAFPSNQQGKTSYVENEVDWSLPSPEEYSWVKNMKFPQLWRNLKVVESLWGQHPSSQQMGMQQGSQGLKVDSTSLSWSCSPWDGQGARWAGKLAPWHPEGEWSLNNFFASTSPPTSIPHPNLPLLPPWALALHSCCTEQVHLKLHSSPVKMCMIFLFETFSLPMITWSILNSVSAKIWGNCISHNSHIKAANIHRNSPSTPPLSWFYSFWLIIMMLHLSDLYWICHLPC